MSKKERAKAETNLDYQDFHNNLKLIIAPKNEEQRELLKTISTNLITVVRGPAGSGKTYVSVAFALRELLKNRYDHIILTRPIVEAAGEKMGYLPGDIYEKIDPYMLPIYDILSRLVPEDVLKKMIGKNGSSKIRILPLAYMRGLSFINSFVIADEFQNSSPEQVRLLLTRFSEGSKMILCGDVNQSDIARTNGLDDVYELLSGVEDIGFVTLTEDSIVRHPIVAKIEHKYQARAEARKKKYDTNQNGRSS
jgi:phosphate starvation-inducible PhoH-like protein